MPRVGLQVDSGPARTSPRRRPTSRLPHITTWSLAPRRLGFHPSWCPNPTPSLMRYAKLTLLASSQKLCIRTPFAGSSSKKTASSRRVRVVRRHLSFPDHPAVLPCADDDILGHIRTWNRPDK